MLLCIQFSFHAPRNPAAIANLKSENPGCAQAQFQIQGNNHVYWEVFYCISELGIQSQARKNNYMSVALWCEIPNY